MTQHQNFLQPGPTLLPEQPEPQQALDNGADPSDVARDCPAFSGAWAVLAERALEGNDFVAAYAYARTGYHRGLDQLRRAGWKGHGPVPWNHYPNQGFLRSLAVLAKAAGEIGETEEHERCRQFITDCDPEAATATGLT